MLDLISKKSKHRVYSSMKYIIRFPCSEVFFYHGFYCVVERRAEFTVEERKTLRSHVDITFIV